MGKIKVSINGFGTIGRRVAYAISKQPDMDLVGVSKRSADYRAWEAVKENIPIYSANGPFEGEIQANGDVEEMLQNSDVVVDCTPKKKGFELKAIYDKHPHLKVIYQGGEKSSIADVSFSAQANYDEAIDKKSVRVVSCNTTALCRVLSQVSNIGKIKKVRMALARRAADPDETTKGAINTWVPDLAYPSHHAFDVNTVLPSIRVVSLAGVAPMSIMHGMMLFMELEDHVTLEDLKTAFSENPRIALLSGEEDIQSTGQIKDSLGSNRRWSDIYEVCIWEKSIGIDQDGEIGLHMAVDQQAIVVPDTVDAVRALMATVGAEESMAITNGRLGLVGLEKEAPA